MADELAGLPQNIAPWFPPAGLGSNAAAEDQAFQREMVPYSLLLARAGQYIPMGDLSGVAPSENIIYDTVDPFERAAARVRAPYAAAVERASAVPLPQEGPFDRLRNEAQQSIADNYAQAMGVGAGDPFERAASRLRAPYAAANLRTSGLPDVAAMLANKFASAATAPRDALTGAMQVIDPETGMPTQEAMQRGQGLANLAMTGGIPMAQRGAAGMAGGKLGGPGEPTPMRNPSNYNKPGAYTARENRIEAVKAIEQEIRKAQQEGNIAAAEFHKKEWSAWHGDKPWPGEPGDRINFQSAQMVQPTEALPKLRSAFDNVRAAQGNVGIAPISELIARSGLSKEEVHNALVDAARRGEVTLHQGNQASESQVIRDAAVNLPGEPPLKYAFFKDQPKGPEPKSREEIRRELREGMAQSKLSQLPLKPR